MTPDEAREFLESHDYCLTHFVRMGRQKGRKPICAQCLAEKERAIEQRADIAIRVLRGISNPHSQSPNTEWREAICGRLPKPQVKVEIITEAYLEPNRPGGKERWTLIGKPTHWRPR